MGRIEVPSTTVEGTRVFIPIVEFVVGIQLVRLKSIQVSRGCMQHWIVATMFWAIFVQPADLLMTFCTEGQTLIRCSNHHIWSGYCDMQSLLQALANDREVRPTLFQNSTDRALALRRRFTGPRIAEEVCWISTDATPDAVGVLGAKTEISGNCPPKKQ